MPIYRSKFQIPSLKNVANFSVKKPQKNNGPSKRLINHTFKKPNQDMYSTLGYTFNWSFDEISECWVPSKLSQMCQKMQP